MVEIGTIHDTGYRGWSGVEKPEYMEDDLQAVPFVLHKLVFESALSI